LRRARSVGTRTSLTGMRPGRRKCRHARDTAQAPRARPEARRRRWRWRFAHDESAQRAGGQTAACAARRLPRCCVATTHDDIPVADYVRQPCCPESSSKSSRPSACAAHRDAGPAVQPGSRCRRLLRDVEAELEQLREQNRLLRHSAGFFADLSERLNAQLRYERSRHRGAGDQRVTPAVGDLPWTGVSSSPDDIAGTLSGLRRRAPQYTTRARGSLTMAWPVRSV
jgi:hypothetical protein